MTGKRKHWCRYCIVSSEAFRGTFDMVSVESTRMNATPTSKAYQFYGTRRIGSRCEGGRGIEELGKAKWNTCIGIALH